MKLLIIDDDLEAMESVELTVGKTWPEVNTVLAAAETRVYFQPIRMSRTWWC